tara:strand:- start:1007 stop:1690 length:684 start_codon:yes stop_codon:yes gene_type:complete
MKIRIIKEVGLNNPSKYSVPGFRGNTDVTVTIVNPDGCEEVELDDDRETLATEQTEPFQKAVKKGHRKMKIRLIGKGGNTYNIGGKMKKPSYERSKSAPPGFGGSLEEGLAAYIPGSSEWKMNKAIKNLRVEMIKSDKDSAWDKISREITETKEAYEIFKKAFKEKLTDEDKKTFWTQVGDLAKGTTLAAIFALPGGSILAPLAISFIGDRILPSAWQKEETAETTP